jgi:hypothetical protein
MEVYSWENHRTKLWENWANGPTIGALIGDFESLEQISVGDKIYQLRFFFAEIVRRQVSQNE